MVQAADTHGMVPTSISNITIVSDIIHMMWMGRKIHHHAATTAARVTAGHHTMPCAVVEAVDSPVMVPKSTYNIIKVFDNIHLVWIDR